jgi:hypothetical protein
MTTEMRNDAIAVYMGEQQGDLKYHESWDWLIPVWVRVRFKLSPTQIIHAINCIDTGDIRELHMLLSQICINWCKENNINLNVNGNTETN